MVERIINRDRSVIVAADVQAESLTRLVNSTCVVEGIGGYKIGLELALGQGLPRVVGLMKDLTDLPIIYDHQKAGNDAPDMGAKFARVCRESGVDAVVLFPFGGATTEREWIRACQDAGLGVLVGGHMTYPEFLYLEGGFIEDEAPERIFRIAVQEGVRDFVVPGSKIEYVEKYRNLFEGLLTGSGEEFHLYAPGGGQISEFARSAGEKWHVIVGSAIYKAVDIKSAAEEMTKEISKLTNFQSG